MTQSRPVTRFLLNVSFKVAGQDWIGYHSMQSRANHPAWVQFVERSTPRELELLGFPPPGHAIWNADLLDATLPGHAFRCFFPVGTEAGTAALARNLEAGVTATGLTVTRVGETLSTGATAVVA